MPQTIMLSSLYLFNLMFRYLNAFDLLILNLKNQRSSKTGWTDINWKFRFICIWNETCSKPPLLVRLMCRCKKKYSVLFPSQELSFRHKLKFSSSNIFPTWSYKPLIFTTLGTTTSFLVNGFLKIEYVFCGWIELRIHPSIHSAHNQTSSANRFYN